MSKPLGHRLPQLLFRSLQIIEEGFSRAIAGNDITMRHVLLLAAIIENPRASQTLLTSVTGIDRSTLAYMVKQLKQKGLITRRRSVKDSRMHEVKITEAGERMASIGNAVLERVEAQFLEAIPQHQLDTLIINLTRAVAAEHRRKR